MNSHSAVLAAGVAALCLSGCWQNSSTAPTLLANRAAESESVAPIPNEAPDVENVVVLETPESASTENIVDVKQAPPVIGQLRSRKHSILIHVGSDGPRFTVSTLDGRVIATALSIDEMQAQHPEIYKLYKDTFAKYDGYLDASSSLDASALPSGGPPASR